MNMTGDEQTVMKLFRDLSANAADIKKKVEEGNIPESGRLIGARVALVEALRELADAKVLILNSDIRSELNALFMRMQRDISDSVGGINARLSELLKGLAKTREAKGIAAYAAMSVPALSGGDPDRAESHPAVYDGSEKRNRSSMVNERDRIHGGRHGNQPY